MHSAKRILRVGLATHTLKEMFHGFLSELSLGGQVLNKILQEIMDIHLVRLSERTEEQIVEVRGQQVVEVIIQDIYNILQQRISYEEDS